MDMTRLRSLLYLPANRPSAIAKARTLAADSVILDLEDAVAPEAKIEARAAAVAAVRAGGFGPRLGVRINALDTEWGADDLAALADTPLDLIVAPKVEDAATVHTLSSRLRSGTALWAMIETPRALLHAEEIAAAHDRLTVIVMGTNDVVNETYGLHVPGRNAVVLTSLAWTLLAVRAAGKVIIDGVYNDVKDPEGFEAEARQGREMGFDGKTLIHPTQVEPANVAFSPSEADVERAEGMIAAFEEAAREKKGVATYKNKMIEELHIRDAKRILAFAEALQGR